MVSLHTKANLSAYLRDMISLGVLKLPKPIIGEEWDKLVKWRGKLMKNVSQHARSLKAEPPRKCHASDEQGILCGKKNGTYCPANDLTGAQMQRSSFCKTCRRILVGNGWVPSDMRPDKYAASFKLFV